MAVYRDEIRGSIRVIAKEASPQFERSIVFKDVKEPMRT